MIDRIAECRAIMARGSRTFSLAARLMGPTARDRVAIFYTWCRSVDDAIDLAPPEAQPAALAELSRHLDVVYDAGAPADGLLGTFRELFVGSGLPRDYLDELLAGMAMDVSGWRYETLDDVLLYAFRVAGTVGLSLCHVLGLSTEDALPFAAHLGMAMQLTNICRDVLEDWQLGRCYLPQEWLVAEGAGGLRDELGRTFPGEAAGPVARVVLHLLAEAERLYLSSAAGLPSLRWDCAAAVRAAAALYRAIGDELRRRGGDVRAGRAVVPRARKAALMSGAFMDALGDLPQRRVHPFQPMSLTRVVRFSDVISSNVARRGGLER